MLVMDNKIFFHLQRTGGGSILENAIKQRPKDIEFIRAHGGVYPISFSSYRKFSIVRNPFDWYRSIGNFMISIKEGKTEFKTSWFEDFLLLKDYDGPSQKSFDSIIENSLNLLDKTEELREVLLKNPLLSRTFLCQPLNRWEETDLGGLKPTLLQYYLKIPKILEYKDITIYKYEENGVQKICEEFKLENTSRKNVNH